MHFQHMHTHTHALAHTHARTHTHTHTHTISSIMLSARLSLLRPGFDPVPGSFLPQRVFFHPQRGSKLCHNKPKWASRPSVGARKSTFSFSFSSNSLIHSQRHFQPNSHCIGKMLKNVMLSRVSAKDLTTVNPNRKYCVTELHMKLRSRKFDPALLQPSSVS